MVKHLLFSFVCIGFEIPTQNGLSGLFELLFCVALSGTKKSEPRKPGRVAVCPQFLEKYKIEFEKNMIVD
ncbi:MAG: hypothetical protein SNJ77_10695 [Cytophagales bacterium]